jgi:hypothetical protein
MQYLMCVIDDKTVRSEAELESGWTATPDEATAVSAFNGRLRAGGHWVFAGGLAGPGAATVIDNRGTEVLVTDGPFLESKEFVAGFWVIEAPNLDVALELAAEGSKHCNRKVELRPFH